MESCDGGHREWSGEQMLWWELFVYNSSVLKWTLHLTNFGLQVDSVPRGRSWQSVTMVETGKTEVESMRWWIIRFWWIQTTELSRMHTAQSILNKTALRMHSVQCACTYTEITDQLLRPWILYDVSKGWPSSLRWIWQHTGCARWLLEDRLGQSTAHLDKV